MVPVLELALVDQAGLEVTDIYLPASASQELKLKVCATTAQIRSAFPLSLRKYTMEAGDRAQRKTPCLSCEGSMFSPHSDINILSALSAALPHRH